MFGIISKVLSIFSAITQALAAYALGAYVVKDRQKTKALKDAEKSKVIRRTVARASSDELRDELRRRGELRD
jgi:hypothetical protein